MPLGFEGGLSVFGHYDRVGGALAGPKGPHTGCGPVHSSERQVGSFKSPKP